MYMLNIVFVIFVEQPYDSIPNFSAADALRLTGIGRNEFIDIMNKCRSKVLLRNSYMLMGIQLLKFTLEYILFVRLSQKKFIDIIILSSLKLNIYLLYILISYKFLFVISCYITTNRFLTCTKVTSNLPSLFDISQ